jgi:hypothetical protein
MFRSNLFCIVLKKIQFFLLILYREWCILILAVTLIAVKREVAALIKQVFRGANVNAGDNLRRRNWRQVTVPKSSAIRRNDARGSNYE